MGKMEYANFESIGDVIREIKIDCRTEEFGKLEEIKKGWIVTIGNKISKLTKVFQISDDNILTVLCADSFVANELYVSKDKIIEMINEKSEKTGIKIRDIRFSYKQWKEET